MMGAFDREGDVVKYLCQRSLITPTTGGARADENTMTNKVETAAQHNRVNDGLTRLVSHFLGGKDEAAIKQTEEIVRRLLET